MQVLCMYERKALNVYSSPCRGGVIVEVDDSDDIRDAFWAKIRSDIEVEGVGLSPALAEKYYTFKSYLPENGLSKFKPKAFN